MADDDPDNDLLLPFCEASSRNETCRSSALDSRERHAVCKLDRYQLEDRYLRLHEQVLQLKKLSNSQEDKIKRLGTKLMRVAATPRPCLVTALDFNNDKSRRVDGLQHENAKLKDKVTALRSQILNHTIVGRSPSRGRRLQICNTSGPTTCRSERGRRKKCSSHSMVSVEDDDDPQNNVPKLAESETEKKEMTRKIEDLENQLADYKITCQREKAADNVEYIRVWRQLKLQNDEFLSMQAANVSMAEQIRTLKTLVEEKTRNNKEITTALLAEKKKFAEMDEQLAKARDSQLSLREKDQQIVDLSTEMKILHQHNAELLALSSKYSQVELENAELKLKVSEQLSDNQSLKSAFSNEQANITALQAANQQLMGKLHDLQTTIDTLTVQLKSFQSQSERIERYKSEHEKLRTMNRQTSTSSLAEKLVAPTETNSDREVASPERVRRERVSSPKKNFADRETQTEKDLPSRSPQVSPTKRIDEKPPLRDRSIQPDNGSGNLKPDEMLRILEEAQINTPLEVQNAARMRQIASTGTNNYVNSFQPGQRSSLTRIPNKSNRTMAEDHWKILLIMYKVLREFSEPNSLPSVLDEQNPSVAPITSYHAPSDPASSGGIPITGDPSLGVVSADDSNITISPSALMPQSDSSNIRAMEDEDQDAATSSDFDDRVTKRVTPGSSNGISKEQEDSSLKIETASIKESIDSPRDISNINERAKAAIPISPRESNGSVQDLVRVMADYNNWDHEYKKRSLTNQAMAEPSRPSISTTDASRSRSRASYIYSERAISNNDAVVIRIESLSLFQKSSVLEDPGIRQLYVEFSFLGYRGIELETMAVPKPTADSPALFNYMRRFEIDKEKHQMPRSIMRAMMTEHDNPTIKFTVVSEPPMDKTDTEECVDVGYANLNIRDHILSGHSNEAALTIMNVEQKEPIGILKIAVLGADAIRRCMSDLWKTKL